MSPIRLELGIELGFGLSRRVISSDLQFVRCIGEILTSRPLASKSHGNPRVPSYETSRFEEFS